MSHCTQHTITAPMPFGFGEIEVEVTYRYLPGRAATGPSYDSGGDPPEPDEVEFVKVEIPTNGGELDLDEEQQKLVDDWASEWLADDGRDNAIEGACDE